MQIKRFEANNMAEAFKAIKQEFGPDAVILSAKTIQKQKGLFHSGRPSRVEVLAANDTYVLTRSNSVPRNHLIQEYAQKSVALENVENKPKKGPFQTIREKLNPLKMVKITPNNPYNETMEDLSELKAIKNRLLHHGVESGIVSEIIEKLQKIKSLKSNRSVKNLKALLPAALEELGVESASDDTTGTKQQVIAVLGLTGVGKTTTLVKMAADHMLTHNRTVGVVSLDNFRVGANALLNVYANILGFRVFCASTPKELKAGLKACKDMDVILVDTPGMGLNHHSQKYQIKELMDKINPDQIHLLMHANVKKADAKEIIRQFELFDYHYILFTKIDETATYGNLLNQLMETEKPISYITTGQNIPEDISKIELEGLVDLLMEDQTDKKSKKAGGVFTHRDDTQERFQRLGFN